MYITIHSAPKMKKIMAFPLRIVVKLTKIKLKSLKSTFWKLIFQDRIVIKISENVVMNLHFLKRLLVHSGFVYCWLISFKRYDLSTHRSLHELPFDTNSLKWSHSFSHMNSSIVSKKNAKSNSEISLHSAINSV